MAHTLALLACATLLSLSLPCTTLHAQDTASASDTLHYGNFDVSQYLIHRWYTSPDKAPFFTNDKSRWLQGWSIEGSWNPLLQLHPSFTDGRLPYLSATAAITRDLGKSDALRLSYGFTRSDNPFPGNGIKTSNDRHHLSLDYLWNLSNHWFGYDPSRSYEWLFVIGGQVGRVYNRGNAPKNYIGGQVGLQVRKTLSPHISLFAEPYYYATTTDFDYARNCVNLDDGIGIKVGFISRLTAPLRINRWMPDNSGHSAIDNWYVQMLLGLNNPFGKNWHFYDLVASDYNVNLNIGRWVSPAWGFQTGFVDRQLLNDDKGSHKTFHTRRQTYLRAEGVLNIPAVFDAVSWGRFDPVVSAGVEIGLDREYSGKSYVTMSRKDHIFPGITSALQLKYYVNANTALIGEERVDFYRPRYGAFTTSLGIEFYRSYYNRYNVRNRQSHTDIPYLTDNNWFIEGGVGFSKSSNQRYNDWIVAPEASIALGYRFDELSSVRVKDYLQHVSGEQQNTDVQTDNQLALDYLLDVTNFWLGADAQRRFTLRAFAGAVYSAKGLSPMKRVKTQHSFAIEYGLQPSIRISPNAEIFAEPRYLYRLGDFNRWNFSAGLAYTFEKRGEYVASTDETQHHYYIQALVGSQIASRFTFHPQGFHPMGDVVFGYNLGRVMAVQGGLFWQEFGTYKTLDDNQSLGARVEAVADVMRMLWTDSHAQGWAWTLQAGYDFGANYTDKRSQFGPTVATQMRRRFGKSPYWFALQGRLQSFSYGNTMAVWSLQGGLHYEF